MVKFFAEPPPFPSHPKNRNRVTKTACSGTVRIPREGWRRWEIHPPLRPDPVPLPLPQGSPGLPESFWRKMMIPAFGVCSRTGSCAGQTGLGDPSSKRTAVRLGCGWAFIHQHRPEDGASVSPTAQGDVPSWQSARLQRCSHSLG